MNSVYIKAFANNQVDGRTLIGVRPYELEELGILSVGHQEIILEAVEHLRNFVRLTFFRSIFIIDRK
jgi:connector enhancer of kinase suppressor of Ras 2